MRRVLIGCALFSVMAYVVTQANAQRFGGGMAGGIGLLMNKGVQEELKITEEQRDKIGEMMKGMFDKRKEEFLKFKELPKDEIGAKMKKMMKEINESAMKELKDVLKPEQIKRFKQIERQQNVVITLTNDEEAAKELKVTDEQKEKMKELVDELEKERGGLFKEKGDFKERADKMAALLKETNEKAIKLLTDEQVAKWKEMTGTPFTIKFEGGFGKKRKKDD